MYGYHQRIQTAQRDLHHDSSVEEREGYQEKGEEREADANDRHGSHNGRPGPDES